MFTRKLLMISFLTLPCLAVPAQQQPGTPTSMSALPPGPFSFAGQWNCRGTFRAGNPHEATFTGAIVVGGRWVELTEVDTLPKTGYIAKYLIGFDPEHKRLVEYDANNFAAATYTSAEGWQGSVLTMTSEPSISSQTAYKVNRFIYTIAGQDAFDVDWQISKAVGAQWTTADHLTCKRIS